MRPVHELRLEATAYTHPDAAALVGEVLAYYVRVYGEGDLTVVTPGQFSPPEGLFLVGYARDEPVACGGWRVRGAGDDPVLRDGDIEIKRMYVPDRWRGHGFGRRVLAELERTATASGGRRIVLESGVRQPEAVGLYTAAGYHPIDRFGAHREDPMSLCFAKPLPVA